MPRVSGQAMKTGDRIEYLGHRDWAFSLRGRYAVIVGKSLGKVFNPTVTEDCWEVVLDVPRDDGSRHAVIPVSMEHTVIVLEDSFSTYEALREMDP